MPSVGEAIRTFAETARFDEPGLVAVSGGADSVALLRGLIDAKRPNIVVAHFNHGLRGDESDADAAFVQNLANVFNLPFRRAWADVKAEAEAAGDNLEATARRLRYGWLNRVAAETGAKWVATGHTADDQAETVMHQLIRGTGLQGLRGIAAWKRLDDLWLYRPILTLTRADVLAYLQALGQPYRTDASNSDPRFTRNRIRHELMPMLKTFNPRAVDALNRLAEHAGWASGIVAEEACALLERIERPRAGRLIVLDTKGLRTGYVSPEEPGDTVSPYLICEMFREIWSREGWPVNGMTFAHWDRLLTIAWGYLTAADFPDGVHVRRAGAVVQLGRRS